MEKRRGVVRFSCRSSSKYQTKIISKYTLLLFVTRFTSKILQKVHNFTFCFLAFLVITKHPASQKNHTADFNDKNTRFLFCSVNSKNKKQIVLKALIYKLNFFVEFTCKNYNIAYIDSY